MSLSCHLFILIYDCEILVLTNSGILHVKIIDVMYFYSEAIISIGLKDRTTANYSMKIGRKCKIFPTKKKIVIGRLQKSKQLMLKAL